MGVGVGGVRGLARMAGDTGMPKARARPVRELELAVLVDEQVLRLEVAVQHAPVVAEGDPRSGCHGQGAVERRG